MLGKLHITANSDAEKLQRAEGLVVEAIDNKIAGDAASRTALNKLHLALSKATGEVVKGRREVNEIARPVVEEGVTIAEEPEESGMGKDADVKIESVEEDGITVSKDSVLDELLEDDDTL